MFSGKNLVIFFTSKRDSMVKTAEMGLVPARILALDYRELMAKSI